jgi:predicted nucleic-acid-binding protein
MAAGAVIGLDTNVLVRYLVADDDAQEQAVRRLLARARSEGETVYISLVVLCETYWVLRSSYGIHRAAILQALGSLLDADVFTVEEPDLLRRAMEACGRSSADFTDRLIGHIHAARGCRHTVTFDRALRAVPDFKVL